MCLDPSAASACLATFLAFLYSLLQYALHVPFLVVILMQQVLLSKVALYFTPSLIFLALYFLYLHIA